ncbi:MAG TPA: hypothetical protein VJ917_02190 [Saprospiraceae bacterium]|nr:hypothetical protein [Saprospiraceae bacterium]
MIRTLIIIALFLNVKTQSFSQTNIYLGGGMSGLDYVDWCWSVNAFDKTGVLWSSNLSLMAKSDLSKDFAVSLGVIYNVNKFEMSTIGWGYSSIRTIGVNYSRYAIPVRAHWTFYHSIYISGGIMLNNIYRLERLMSNDERLVYEYNRPDFSYNFGIGAEWKGFLIDISMARNISETDLWCHNKYWTFDFNVYYRILSSGKE